MPMSANAFAISRRLAERGVDKQIADAVAEEIVTHSDDNLATKADIARLEVQMKLLTAMVAGLYVGGALLFVSRLL